MNSYHLFKTTVLTLSILFIFNQPSLASDSYEEIDVQDGGSITGKVEFTGAIPSQEELKVTKDNAHCGAKVPMETALVEGTMVRNVVITIENIKNGKKIVAKNATLDNKKCIFVPHVQSMTMGNYLEITNSDEVLHNTHGYLDKTKTAFNLALPIKNQKIKKKMKTPGLINVVCDAGHTWMNAYIVVAEHPYHTVTDERGAFKISDIPPGKYQIKAWHESLGNQTLDVEVRAGKNTDITFSKLNK